MASKFQLVTELYNDSLATVTSNYRHWTIFLEAACRNYKCSFDEQLLIYAQRSDATAVLSYDRWNTHFNRVIRRGSKGIALFDLNKGTGRLKYVFDISDTLPGRNAKPVPVWRMRDEFEGAVVETLVNTFGADTGVSTMEDIIWSACHNAAQDNLADYLIDLRNQVDGSLLEELDDINLSETFTVALESSVAYMIMTRLGLDAGAYFTPEDFSWVYEFNTPATTTILGAATSAIAEMGLREISQTVMQAQRDFGENLENKGLNRLINLQNQWYTQPISNPAPTTSGRRTEHETDISRGREWGVDSQSGNAQPAPGGSGEIRPDASGLSQDQTEGPLHHSADRGQDDRTPTGDPAGGGEPVRQADEGHGDPGGRDGGAEGQRPNEVDGLDEQPEAVDGGDFERDSDLLLKDSESEPETPAMMDLYRIEKVLLDNLGRKDKWNDICQYFGEHLDFDQRREYLKNTYTETYCEVMVDGKNDDRVGYKAQKDGLMICAGHFLSCTAKSVFSWGHVSEMMEQLIETGDYQLNLTPLPEPPSNMVEQISIFDMGNNYYEEAPAPQMTAFTPKGIPEEVITQVLYTAGNQKNSAYRVFTQYRTMRPEEENVSFLKSEFKTDNGRGIIYNDKKYAVWFTSDGIRFALGDSVRTGLNQTLISWEECSQRIATMMAEGHYIGVNERSAAHKGVYCECAESLMRCVTELRVKPEVSPMPTVEQFYQTYPGWPEKEEKLAEYLGTPEGMQAVVEEYLPHAQRLTKHPNMFYGSFNYYIHRIDCVLGGFGADEIVDVIDESFVRTCEMFITLDELEENFISDNQDSKLRLYSHFCRNTDTKSRQDFLKERYGGGRGHGYYGYSSSSTAKGTTFRRSYQGKDYEEVSLNIAPITKFYERLISEQRFLTENEQMGISEYQMSEIARAVRYAFENVPEGTPRPYPVGNTYYEAIPSIKNLLLDKAKVAALIATLDDVLAGVTEDNRYYDLYKQARIVLVDYHAGTYDLFAGKHPDLTAPMFADAVPAIEIPEVEPVIAPEEQEESETYHPEPDESPYDALAPAPAGLMDAYNSYKEQYPDHIVAIQCGVWFEIYGDEAEIASEILGTTIVEREFPGGAVLVTGIADRDWAVDMKRLWERGNNVVLISCDDGEYSIRKERLSKDYLPIGAEIVIDDRKFAVDDVDFKWDKVSLRDITFNDRSGYPIFRAEHLKFVRSYYEDQMPAVTEAEVTEALSETIQQEEILPPPAVKHRVATPLYQPLNPDGRNYRITDNALGVGGPKEKFQRNLAAIELLKTLETEERTATPEEQETLAQYVGWGGLADAFDSEKSSWASEYTALRDSLADSEYTAARASTLTAFYTPPIVIDAIYTTLENLGFRAGNILEPACGTGNFLGLLPRAMADSKLYGVELDSISGRIARQLYPASSVVVQGFETTQHPDNFFDVAVGNVPFGQFKVPDKRYDKQNFSIHDYFFAKSLDKVRPGGVVAFVTSSFTMDKQSPDVRKYLAQRAELLGAIRLPNNTFSNAGTDVTSDIIFLQKRDRIVDIEPDWVHLGQTENGIAINQYFADNPDMILGTMTMISGPYGPEPTCAPHAGDALDDLLANAILNIQGEITAYNREENVEGEVVSIPADPSVRNFSYTVVDDKIYYRENSIMRHADVSKTADGRIRGMISLRDCVRTLIDYQMEDYTDSEIIEQQQKLNWLYDGFTAKYGLINSRGNSLAFSQDSSYFLLCSLENLDEHGELASKADLFSKRTIRAHQPVDHVDTSVEALALSIGEKAGVDILYMTHLTGFSEEKLVEDLRGVIFQDPQHHDRYFPADEYLSGNVRQKLALVTALADPAFSVHRKALEAVQPTELGASEISVRLGAPWVEPWYIEQFVFELMQTPRYSQVEMGVRYSPTSGEWRVINKSEDRKNIRNYSTYGTQRIGAYEIIESTLNLKDVRVFDYLYDADGRKVAQLNKQQTAIAQSKQEIIKEQFSEWIWKDPERRNNLCKIYNEKFNSNRPRVFDGSHIQFNGMNPEIALRAHQSDAVARCLYGGNTLLAHVVGAGKTYTMVAAAMESKRLGLCQKSLFVVPNHLTEQWATEFLQLYPAANILVATRKDFETKNRKKFCGRIATGDYDAIIIGHSQFEKIPMSVERQRRIIEGQIDDVLMSIREAKSDKAERFTIKQMEKTRKGLETRLAKLNDQGRKDDIVTFEELGVDRLYIDESHYYKNLFLFTKMRNVGGIAQTEAQKSSDLYMKCSYLDEITGGKGIVFASGTPISNSMVELYTIHRYLQMAELNHMGLQHFDSWAATYGETTTAIELAPEGTGYRAKTRFSKFNNLPELMSFFSNVADVQTADMLNLPVPEVEYHTVALKPTEHQVELVASLADRAEAVRNKQVDSSVDNMLLITNDGRKLALDQRLINPLLPDDEGGKSAQCADNVVRIWRETAEGRLTQLIFCDLSTPKNNGEWNVYNDIKAKLIAKGIPESEVAFIHDAKTEVQKNALFSKVRSGQVRVLVGSTPRMGAGTNVQKRLIALHHLDCPWRPSDLQQREGRIVRQGNDNAKVEIFSYVTEQTFDSYLYQLVESKQRFIGQIMTSKSPVRSAEDIDEQALSYAEIKALATGNPLIKEKMDLDIAVGKLKLLKSNYLNQKYQMEDEITKYIPTSIANYTAKAEGYAADAKTVAENTHENEDGFSPMTIGNNVYTDKKTAGEVLVQMCKSMVTSEDTPIGSYRGMKMELGFESFGKEFVLTLAGALRHRVTFNTGNQFGTIQRLDNLLAKLGDKRTICLDRLEECEKQLVTAQDEVTKPFAKEEELSTKLARLKEVDSLLNMDEKQSDNEIEDENQDEIDDFECE